MRRWWRSLKKGVLVFFEGMFRIGRVKVVPRPQKQSNTAPTTRMEFCISCPGLTDDFFVGLLFVREIAFLYKKV